MDVRTILYINLFLLTGCMVALAVIAFHNPRFREFRWLAIAYAAGGLGTLLRTQQGHIPDFLSLVASNTVQVAALLLVHQSFATFVHADKKTGWTQAVLLLAAFSGLLYFTYVRVSFPARALVMSVAYIGVAAMSARVLIRYADDTVRVPCAATALLYIAFGVMMALRCIGMLLGGTPHDFFTSSVPHLIGFLAFYVLIAGIPLGYFWMTSARLYGNQEQLARTDFLTGLPNRRAMEEQAAHEIERRRREGTSLVLLVMDVDHFKRINDEYGHDTGDAALRMIASALAMATRRQDCIARLGGEEFTILLTEMNLEAAIAIAEKLRLIIEELPIVTGPHIVRTTASFGVAAFGQDDTFATVLQRADRALYAAKLGGRNRVMMESAPGCYP